MQITYNPEISEWVNPVHWRCIIPIYREANAVNWNILVTAGIENNSDSPSSGERTGISPNHICYGKCGVVGLRYGSIINSRTPLERVIKEGDNPVDEIKHTPSSILSRAGPVKSCLNQPAPSGKTKYSWETDSEQVPWGKGEKYPEQGSEIVPETVRLQAVGATLCCDGVPFA